MVIQRKTDIWLPEALFTGKGDLAMDRRVLRLASKGELLKLYQGVYTASLERAPESVVQRNWARIVGHLLPNGVLSYRSGYDVQPVDGYLYVTRGNRRRILELPGLTIKVIPGPGAEANDTLFKGFFLPSTPRWLLENLAVGRGVAGRVLSRDAVEAEIDKILSIRGTYRFVELRDACRSLAEKLGRGKEFKRLDGIMGAMLAAKEFTACLDSPALSTSTALKGNNGT